MTKDKGRHSRQQVVAKVSSLLVILNRNLDSIKPWHRLYQILYKSATSLVCLDNLVARRFLHTNLRNTGPQYDNTNKVSFISYNSRGFNEFKQDFMRFLLNSSVSSSQIPILCNQENFILRDNSYKLRKAFPGFHLLINPAVKKSLNTGRPSNGMFIAIPDSIKNNVEDVSPGFWRVQAATLSFQSSKLLLINTYFPTDPQRVNTDESDLLETLGYIKRVVDSNPCDGVLVVGDLNSDFSRQSSHSRAVKDALEELSLELAWDKFSVDFTATHEMLGQTFISTLDHFAWSEQVGGSVTDGGVLHLPDNQSDHCPIYCTVDLPSIQHNSSAPRPSRSRPSWRKATDQQKNEYRNILEEKLARLSAPESVLTCMDVHCQDVKHREDLDKYTIEVLETVQGVAEDCLPVPSGGRTSSIRPGWLEQVKPYREVAYFWHQVWKSADKPINTELHRIMKRSRNTYHYEFKKCKKAEEQIKRNKLLSACLDRGGGDLFKELKSLRKAPSVTANSIDGVSSDIPNHFSKIYSTLYNSASDVNELEVVHQQVNSAVNSASLDTVTRITPELLKNASCKLKAGKSDPVYSFSSDCFKTAADSLYVHLSSIMKSCTVHSHVSQVLLLSTLVPLVKDKLGNINSSKNYRSVAISSILLKLIDWVIILLEGSCLGLDELQFAYQAGCSDTMCTWAATETINYFLNQGSEVFTCATVMSKAFDLTLHSLMFSKMFKAGVSAILVRLLIFIYSNQLANVCWNNEHSEAFTVKNGCGQGKVLAALAYCLYCEELFQTLRRKRSGCWVLGKYRGIFGYSDDNWLIAPSISALQDMLYTCQEFAARHNLKFSTDPEPRKCKTKCMAFLFKQRELPRIMLCGNPLPWVDRLLHLGNLVSNKLDGGQADMELKVARYIDRNCNINQEFRFAHPASKIALNSIYNCHFTGCQLWDLFSPGAEKFYGTYNRSIKVMAGLPYSTHRYLIEPLSEKMHMSRTLMRNFLSFIAELRKSSKPVLRQLYDLSKNDVLTTTGANLRNILLLTNLSNVDHLKPCIVDQISYKTIKKEDQWRVELIKELIDMKCGVKNLPEEMTMTEVEDILDLACTQ